MDGELKLKAFDEDDLVIISSLCQDAIIKEHEYGYDKKSKRFAILMNRFCHESNDQKRIRTAIHFDYVDNIIVQCEGITNFRVWDSSLIDPMGSNQKLTFVDDEEDDTLLDVIMEPGDAIWVPKHCPHQAISKTERFSVSFPMDDFEFDGVKYYQERDWQTL